VRRWVRLAAIVTVLALAALIGACGGGDDGDDSPPAPPPPSEVPFGNRDAPPPSASQLPPEFIECMAKKGYDVASSADIHSAPPQVLQACFGSLH
jgi:hypothetical protein